MAWRQLVSSEMRLPTPARGCGRGRARGALSPEGLPLRGDAVGRELVVDRAAADPEHLGGRSLVAILRRQGVEDHLLFDRLHGGADLDLENLLARGLAVEHL